jgi:integrase
VTLSQAAERYLATATNRGNPRSRDERRIVAHLVKTFGADTPLREITAGRVSEYKDQRRGIACTGRERGAAAINRPLATLRHLLQLAHAEWELIDAVPRIRLEREPQHRIVWLEPDEEQRLLDAAQASRTKHLHDLIVVALESGLRKTELLELEWDRVDLSRGIIRLEKTKSGKRREVPMRQRVYDVLAARAGDRKGRVWPAGDIRSAFETAVEAAQLEKPFTFHGCRHHFASWFVMRGGSLVALQQILGHATLAMTMKYAHVGAGHLRDEVARTERPAASSMFDSKETAGSSHESLSSGVAVS